MKNIGWTLAKIAIVVFCVAVWYMIGIMIYNLIRK
jgi:hypothetical protein